MSNVRIGEPAWLTRTPRERDLGTSPGRGRRGALVRGAGLAGLAALVAALALTSLPPPDLAAAAPVAVSVPAAPKSAARLAAWNSPHAPAPATLPAAAPTARAEPSPGLFEPRADAGPARGFEPGAVTRMAAHAFIPRPAPSPAAQPEGWREAEYARVDVLDGRTLDAGDMRIVIAGIGLPDPGQMCRTLDGRIEPCIVRARTQLELLTRGRTIACRVRAVASGAAEGSCRIGASDLAERLLKTGFVHRRDDESRAVAFVDVLAR